MIASFGVSALYRFGRLSTRRLSGALLVLGLTSALACATAGSGPPSAGLQVSGNVADATIWIDDRLSGQVADFSKPGKRLPAGFHRVEVRAPGYYSHFQEVDAKPGADVTIQANLHELLD